MIKHLTKDRLFEVYSAQLQDIICKIVLVCDDLSALLLADNFLPFLDLIQRESAKVDVSKAILNAVAVYVLWWCYSECFNETNNTGNVQRQVSTMASF